MTALINVEGALPRPLWALTRHLLGVPGKRQKVERVQAFVSPPSLFGNDRVDKEATFEKTVNVAKELGLLQEDGGYLVLAQKATALANDDIDGFYDILRNSVLHRVTADVLGTDPSHTRGKDLVRALCFFMTLRSDTQVNRNTFSKEQAGVMADEFKNPLRNQNRWDLFPSWAEALGFAAAPLIYNQRATALVVDCRKAVRRTILRKWPVDTTLSPQDLITGLLDELPVLPGGAYSRALGFESPDNGASQALSAALLAGHDEGWLVLTSRSDASSAIQLWDPDEGTGSRSVSGIEIKAAA